MIQLPNTAPLFPPIDLFPRKKTLDDLPQREFMRRGFKIFVLGALAWDYTDTVLNEAKRLNLPDETKKITRTIHELRKDFDSVHAQSITLRKDRERELEVALDFEDLCRAHLDKLVYGLNNDKIVADLVRGHKMLVNAVQQAMTVIDAMKLYAVRCDTWIRSHGVEGKNSMLPVHFIALAKLLPELAGDCYNADSEARRITARVLVKELERIELYDDEGVL